MAVVVIFGTGDGDPAHEFDLAIRPPMVAIAPAVCLGCHRREEIFPEHHEIDAQILEDEGGDPRPLPDDAEEKVGRQDAPAGKIVGLLARQCQHLLRPRREREREEIRLRLLECACAGHAGADLFRRNAIPREEGARYRISTSRTPRSKCSVPTKSWPSWPASARASSSTWWLSPLRRSNIPQKLQRLSAAPQAAPGRRHGSVAARTPGGPQRLDV